MGNKNLILSARRHPFPTYQEYRNSAQTQIFSIPNSAIYYIYYISKNPSTSKVYQKLIKSCKYFFIKNSILIIPCFKFNENEWKTCHDEDGWNRPSIWDIPLELNLPRISNKPWKFNHFNISAKIWITSHFSIYIGYPTFFDLIKHTIYKCDAEVVDLMGQTVTFEEFLFFAKNAVTLYLDEKVQILLNDGSEVPCENIVFNLLNLRQFHYTFNKNITARDASSSFKELVKAPHFKKLKICSLANVPELFDVDTFYDYIKKNKTTKAALYYNDDVPLSNAYRIKLQGVVDKLLADFYPLFITFPGETSRTELLKLCNSVKILND